MKKSEIEAADKITDMMHALTALAQSLDPDVTTFITALTLLIPLSISSQNISLKQKLTILNDIYIQMHELMKSHHERVCDVN